MIYQFKKHEGYQGVSAQTIGDELERIRNANDGQLSTTEVVTWAAEPDSPIHECFTWDTEIAASKYRLEEARRLIRSVVVITTETEEPKRAFWNVAIQTVDDRKETITEHYYQSADVISRSPHEFNAALRIMVSKLAGAIRGLDELKTLAPANSRTVIVRAKGTIQSAQQQLSDLAERD